MTGAYPEAETPQRVTVQDTEQQLRGAMRDVAAYWDDMLPDIRARRTENGIEVTGTDRAMDAVVVDVRGASLFRGAVADGLIPVGRSSGFLFLDLKDPSSGLSVRKRIDPAL